MANLRRADLAGANLSNCCFERSCLSGAHMDVRIVALMQVEVKAIYIAPQKSEKSSILISSSFTGSFLKWCSYATSEFGRSIINGV